MAKTNMIRKKIRKILAITGIVVAGLFLFAGSFYNSGRVAWAEEEDEEDEEDESESQAQEEKDEDKKDEQSGTQYETIYRQLPATIVETPVTTIKHDSDGDGLYDDEDAHPTINDYFIVKDDNLDGIDDRYDSEQSLLGKN